MVPQESERFFSSKVTQTIQSPMFPRLPFTNFSRLLSRSTTSIDYSQDQSAGSRHFIVDRRSARYHRLQVHLFLRPIEKDSRHFTIDLFLKLHLLPPITLKRNLQVHTEGSIGRPEEEKKPLR